MGLFDLITDVVRIVAAPIEIAADIAGAIVKPIADVADDAVEGVRETIREIMD